MLELLRDIENSLNCGTQYPLVLRVREQIKLLESGKAKVEVFSDYWIFWQGDKQSVSVSHGSSEASAFSNAGYSAGALRAVDWIEDVPTGIAVLRRRSWPSSESARVFVANHIVAQLDLLFAQTDFDQDIENTGSFAQLIDDARAAVPAHEAITNQKHIQILEAAYTRLMRVANKKV